MNRHNPLPPSNQALQQSKSCLNGSYGAENPNRFNRFAVSFCALALLTGAALFAMHAQAQTPEASPAPSSPASAPTAAVVSPATAAPATPRYSADQIAQMFSFIDRNKDGKISREEAAGFPGVARHFDEADTNKDGFLSREEFENAMSKVK